MIRADFLSVNRPGLAEAVRHGSPVYFCRWRYVVRGHDVVVWQTYGAAGRRPGLGNAELRRHGVCRSRPAGTVHALYFQPARKPDWRNVPVTCNAMGEQPSPEDGLQSLMRYLGGEINQTDRPIDRFSDGIAMRDAWRLGLVEASGSDGNSDGTTYHAVDLTPDGRAFCSALRDRPIGADHKR